MKKLTTLVLCMAVALAACNFAPKYIRPLLDLPEEVEGDYSIFTTEKWWEIFEDPALNDFEGLALANNLDLVAAMARVDEARAAAGIAAADRLPSVGYDADASVSDSGTKVEDYSASLSFAYELDLWGKYRNASAAARERLLATEAQKDAVRLTLTADVARAYFAVRTAEAQIAINEQTLKDREESVRIYKVRYDNGFAGEADLRRIEAERDGVKAALAQLKIILSQNETALLLLTGASPKDIAKQDVIAGKELAAITQVPVLPEDIPSSLLLHRPDVRAAEHALVAANADIGVARAAYFPNITLTGGAGVEGGALSNLFTNGIWNFKANVNGPVFKGGRLRAGVEQMNARQRQAAAAYERAVQNAFKETADAFTANRLNQEVYAAQNARAAALARSLELIQKQYDSGLVSMLDVLDVQRGYLAAQTDETAAIQAKLNATVAISKALGGGM